MKRPLLSLACILCLPCGSGAQEASSAPPSPAVEELAWSFGVALFRVFVPGQDDFLQPTLLADRGRLHLEARYNYEELDTASVWAGWNLGWGDELSLQLTPMLGLAFGDVDGVALGYRGTVEWWRLELSSEGEYLYDLDDGRDSFFFTWSQLSLAPVDWLRAGLAVQRTRVYASDRDLQRGFVLGLVADPIALSLTCFNPDEHDPIWLLGVELGF